MSRLIEGTGDQPMGQTGQGEVLVSAQGVSKKFCRSLKRSLWYGVQDVVSELNPFSGSRRGGDIERELREGEFWAVNDVSFELRRGECLGLIGHNGAGKTTLLKMLNGLIKPDRGHIEMRGRVGALIALGAGFNPILTGRENIYVNATILGLTKRDIDEKIDDIIDFAEIGQFIDAPVQSYSSGMQVRLGFAVATAVQPDILILDEVLAVGDAAFRAKCFRRIGQVSKESAILFVSHDQSQISRICDLAMFMERGTCKFLGTVSESLERYRNSQTAGQQQPTLQLAEQVTEFRPKWQDPLTVDTHDQLTIEFSMNLKSELSVGIGILNLIDASGMVAAQIDLSNTCRDLPTGRSTMRVKLERIDLAAGIYTLNVAFFGINRRQTLVHLVNCATVQVRGQAHLWCNYKVPVKSVTFHPATVS